MSLKDFDFDDEKPDANAGTYFEFECPECNAHNPHDEGFKAGSEIMCFYCGVELKVSVSDGKLKFKPA
jgi:hypothetical protein